MLREVEELRHAPVTRQVEVLRALHRSWTPETMVSIRDMSVLRASLLHVLRQCTFALPSGLRSFLGVQHDQVTMDTRDAFSIACSILSDAQANTQVHLPLLDGCSLYVLPLAMFLDPSRLEGFIVATDNAVLLPQLLHLLEYRGDEAHVVFQHTTSALEGVLATGGIGLFISLVDRHNENDAPTDAIVHCIQSISTQSKRIRTCIHLVASLASNPSTFAVAVLQQLTLSSELMGQMMEQMVHGCQWVNIMLLLQTLPLVRAKQLMEPYRSVLTETLCTDPSLPLHDILALITSKHEPGNTEDTIDDLLGFCSSIDPPDRAYAIDTLSQRIRADPSSSLEAHIPTIFKALHDTDPFVVSVTASAAASLLPLYPTLCRSLVPSPLGPLLHARLSPSDRSLLDTLEPDDAR